MLEGDRPKNPMKRAPIFVLAGAILAATAWFLTDRGSGLPAAEGISAPPPPAREKESLARIPNGEDVGDSRARVAAGQSSAVVAAPEQSGSANPTRSSAQSVPNAGPLAPTELSGDIEDPSLPLPVFPTSDSQATGGPGSTPATDAAPQLLVPVTPAGASTVSPPVVVPPGARLPALFLDERPLPAAQRRVLDRVANDFIDAVASDPSGQDRALWEAARAEADQQYIKLYGHAAYNSLHLQAAKEALRERRATATPPPP